MKKIDLNEIMYETFEKVFADFLTKVTKDLTSYCLNTLIVLIILTVVLLVVFLIHLSMACHLCCKERRRDLKDKLKAKYIKDTQAHIYASINQRNNFDRLNEEMTSINVPTISAESSRIADLPSRTALDTIVAAVNQKATSTLTEPKNNFKRFAF